MPQGSCPRCGRAYTAGEVTGMGILRPRPEAQGGPWMEFPCPGCRVVLRLLPHGHGRYAEPGEPPPPPPDARERRVPWSGRAETAPEVAPPPDLPAPGGDVPRAAPAGSSAPPSAPPPPPVPPRPAPPGARAPTADGAEPPLDLATAERLLRLLPGYTAADVERAFRRRALLCHPDKVSHLDEDFQSLAAKKFKRLKEARDLLGGA